MLEFQSKQVRGTQCRRIDHENEQYAGTGSISDTKSVSDTRSVSETADLISATMADSLSGSLRQLRCRLVGGTATE